MDHKLGKVTGKMSTLTTRWSHMLLHWIVVWRQTTSAVVGIVCGHTLANMALSVTVFASMDRQAYLISVAQVWPVSRQVFMQSSLGQ